MLDCDVLDKTCVCVPSIVGKVFLFVFNYKTILIENFYYAINIVLELNIQTT